MFFCADETVQAAWQSARLYWRFDVDSGQFLTASVAVGPQTLVNSLISAAGLTATASAKAFSVAGLTRSDVSRRALPL